MSIMMAKTGIIFCQSIVTEKMILLNKLMNRSKIEMD